ncbi:hypothetical protein [Yinghuangia soli]|uniref:Uncharacterized protein n=1 Tax=Yinghuangia soli TaxID=2908204 RepID=A0AA41U0M9_9ACTN|nr:hypothetical protein [Yinghuangia soli]MCF2529978.1 hypothetical protein [Yinghuangia soli]
MTDANANANTDANSNANADAEAPATAPAQQAGGVRSFVPRSRAARLRVSLIAAVAALALLAVQQFVDRARDADAPDAFCAGMIDAEALRDQDDRSRLAVDERQLPAPGMPYADCRLGSIEVRAQLLARDPARVRPLIWANGNSALPLGAGLEGMASPVLAWLVVRCPDPVLVTVGSEELRPELPADDSRGRLARWVHAVGAGVLARGACGTTLPPLALAVPQRTEHSLQSERRDAELDWQRGGTSWTYTYTEVCGLAAIGADWGGGLDKSVFQQSITPLGGPQFACSVKVDHGRTFDFTVLRGAVAPYADPAWRTPEQALGNAQERDFGPPARPGVISPLRAQLAGTCPDGPAVFRLDFVPSARGYAGDTLEAFFRSLVTAYAQREGCTVPFT